MNHTSTLVTNIFTTVIFFGLYCMGQVAAALEVGDRMPDFNLQASDGKSYTLSQFKGKQPVVIAFFPKTFTPG